MFGEKHGSNNGLFVYLITTGFPFEQFLVAPSTDDKINPVKTIGINPSIPKLLKKLNWELKVLIRKSSL